MEFEVLQEALVEVMNVAPNEIHMDTTLAGDLGMDSLDAFQIILKIQETISCKIQCSRIYVCLRYIIGKLICPDCQRLTQHNITIILRSILFIRICIYPSGNKGASSKHQVIKILHIKFAVPGINHNRTAEFGIH